MTTVPFRTPNRCGECGAEWYDTHTCPNAPRSTSAPQIVDVVRQVQLGEAATAPVCGCGLPMSRNPHPDAGKPNQAGVEVGYVWECIPCLVKTRNRVGANWRAAQERIRSLAVALQTHRADMHSTSSRPCSTCRTSADALTEVGVTPFVEGTGMDRMAAIAAAQQATGGSNGRD